MNKMEGMRFPRNGQNTRSFGKFLAGNPRRPPAAAGWLPVEKIGMEIAIQNVGFTNG